MSIGAGWFDAGCLDTDCLGLGTGLGLGLGTRLDIGLDNGCFGTGYFDTF